MIKKVFKQKNHVRRVVNLIGFDKAFLCVENQVTFQLINFSACLTLRIHNACSTLLLVNHNVYQPQKGNIFWFDPIFNHPCRYFLFFIFLQVENLEGPSQLTRKYLDTKLKKNFLLENVYLRLRHEAYRQSCQIKMLTFI